MSKWISVDTIPPPVGIAILIRFEDANGEAEVDAAYIDNQNELETFNGWACNRWALTHWMPMPYADLEGSATT